MPEHAAGAQCLLWIDRAIGIGPTGRTKAAGLHGIEHPQRFVDIASHRKIVHGGILQDSRRIDEEQAACGCLFVRNPDTELPGNRAIDVGCQGKLEMPEPAFADRGASQLEWDSMLSMLTPSKLQLRRAKSAARPLKLVNSVGQTNEKSRG